MNSLTCIIPGACLILGATIGGCGAAGGTGEPENPGAELSALEPAPIEQVLDWTLGSETRGVPTERAETALFLVKPGTAPGTAATPRRLTRCMEIQDALPLPGADGQHLLLTGDKLYRVSPGISSDSQASSKPGSEGASTTALAALETSPVGVSIVRLITAARHAPPIVLLAVVRARSGQALWRFELLGDTAVGAPVEDLAALRDLERFSRDYRVERCRPGARDCLVAVRENNEVILDVASRPGAPRRELGRVALPDARRAWWQAADQDGVYLLGSCPSKVSSVATDSSVRVSSNSR